MEHLPNLDEESLFLQQHIWQMIVDSWANSFHPLDSDPRGYDRICGLLKVSDDMARFSASQESTT